MRFIVNYIQRHDCGRDFHDEECSYYARNERDLEDSLRFFDLASNIRVVDIDVIEQYGIS